VVAFGLGTTTDWFRSVIFREWLMRRETGFWPGCVFSLLGWKKRYGPHPNLVRVIPAVWFPQATPPTSFWLRGSGRVPTALPRVFAGIPR
jgi:hypothetical protein